MRTIGFALLCVLSSAPVAAQAFVAGGLGADAALSTTLKVEGFQLRDASGPVFNGSLRAGNALGERWGVELEMALGAVSHQRGLSDAFDSLTLGFTSIGAPSFSSPTIGSSQTIDTETRVRRSTLATTVWLRQAVSSRVDLAYIAGVGFAREAVDQDEYAFRFRTSLHTISYGYGPIVGLEAQVRLRGQHLKLIPGIRVHGVSDDNGHEVLVRPSVGLGWFF